jgi:hypothetical protein
MPVSLQDIQKPDNGARFLSADLHIHSYGGSADVKDRSMTVEAIIEAAVAKGISLLAITDHNSDCNTQASIQYAQKYGGQVLVLPGVEVTTAHGHLLAYFPPERMTSVRDLLARIKLVGQPGGRDSHTEMSMTTVIHEIEDLGGVAIAAHIDRAKTGFEAIASGYPNWKKDILTASGLYGLEFDDARHLPWYSADDEATPEGAERKKLLSARAASGVTAARPVVAALQNSDAHSLGEFKARPELTRFKMNELSFDSFRTALIDSGARVRPTATIPPTIPRVIGVHFAGGFLDGETIHLSNNLNCFIGGRGTGKSTAVRSLAYGLGIRDDFGDHDNCPDRVVIYGADVNGVLYRYERTRNMAPEVRAKEDQSIKNVPQDAFRIEFFGQGDLAEVAKDPLKHPTLLQEFLDRHISIQDLCDRESELLKSLTQNSSQIIPLANTSSQLPAKKITLINLDAKLKIAETGKVTEIAAFQTRLAAEKALAAELMDVSQGYENGLSLAGFSRDYDSLADVAGTLTGDAKSLEILEKIKTQIESANAFLAKEEEQINQGLKRFAKQLRTGLDALDIKHKELDEGLGLKVADLRQKGLSGSVEELNALIKQRTALAAEIARIERREPELKKLLEERTRLLQELNKVREQVIDRRKAQLSAINKNLTATIKDYSVNLYYDPRGIIDEFKLFVLDVMHGTYFQEDAIEAFCPQTTPQDLASLIAKGAEKQVAEIPAIGSAWAAQVCRRFSPLDKRHMLETIWKPPAPVIKVRTKGAGSKEISINQLSDGQKHTILLTIAMLAESNLPLVIDQPEDDLDNAFIFHSLVSTLRSIKERRQVIVVTHNANIAVLGDSELILSMKRNGDKGMVTDRGSIDRGETKKAVQGILEGGELAFCPRKEIYGH